MIDRQALRARGAKCEAWSDRCVGGASAFVIAAVWSGLGVLWIPGVVIGVTALVLFAVAMVLGGRTL